MSFRWRIVLPLTLGAAPWSSACVIPGLSHEVTFAPGSAVLSARDVKSVAAWYVDLRDGPFGIADLSVSAYSTKGGQADLALSKARVAAVADLMTTLTSTHPVPLDSDVLGTSAAKAQAFPEVRISAQPQCAATHSCCGADPNVR